MTLLGAEHGFVEVEPHDPAERRADREVVVLLHGLGGNKSDWSFPAWRSYHWDVDDDPALRPPPRSDGHRRRLRGPARPRGVVVLVRDFRRFGGDVRTLTWASGRLDDLRDIALHVITETACHAGHLDAARELLDGRTWRVVTE